MAKGNNAQGKDKKKAKGAPKKGLFGELWQLSQDRRPVPAPRAASDAMTAPVSLVIGSPSHAL